MATIKSYANTTVSAAKTREQLEKLLISVGAVGFRWSSNLEEGSEIIEAALKWEGRQIAFRLRVEFEDERERRQQMRALYWYMKAKIEAIHFGLVDLQQEFLPYLLTEGGTMTVFESIQKGKSQLLLQEAADGPVAG